MKQLITILSFIIMSFSIAQKHTFTVLATKGDNKVITTSSEVILKAGDKLNSSDKIFVPIGGYIGLLHKNGQTLEIRDNKAILVATLEQKIKATITSSKYTDFLFNNTKKVKHNYNITAAVERQPSVNLIANEQTLYIKEIPLNIAWKKPTTTKKETITATLTDLTPDETQFSIKRNDTIVNINFSIIKSSLLKFELLNIEKNHRANTILTPIERNDVDEIVKGYKELVSSIDTSKATDLLILVTFFDSYNLPQYTTSTLLDIIQIEPNIPHYRELLNKYIQKSN